MNTKLDAHQAKLYINAPRGVSFVKPYAEGGQRVTCIHLNSTNEIDASENTQQQQRGRQQKTSKSSNKPESNFTRLECDIGNPFKRGQKLRLLIEYQVIELPIDTNELVFKLELNRRVIDSFSFF